MISGLWVRQFLSIPWACVGPGREDSDGSVGDTAGRDEVKVNAPAGTARARSKKIALLAMLFAVAMTFKAQLLLLGGRSGVGKTTVAYAVSDRLQQLGVAHCHVEGDNLNAVYPKPGDDPRGTKLTEANLRALWRNYRRLGVPRMIYVNTVSVIEPELVVRSLGGGSDYVSVLLTAEDATVSQRLGVRERGGQLTSHLERSRRMARVLEEATVSTVHRVATDLRSPDVVAAEIVGLTGWASAVSASI